MPAVADSLDSAADELLFAVDALRWLARVERRGKLPPRPVAATRRLVRSAEAAAARIKSFGAGDPDLDSDDLADC